MKIYIAGLNCGCCEAEMLFGDEESISKAFQNAGLTSIGVIVDDAGQVHESVDTFYGFWEDANESVANHSLQALVGKLLTMLDSNNGEGGASS